MDHIQYIIHSSVYITYCTVYTICTVHYIKDVNKDGHIHCITSSHTVTGLCFLQSIICTVLVVGHSTMAIQSYILAYYRTDRYICSNIQPIQTYTSRWSKRRDNQICASCPPLIEEIQVWSRVYTGTS